MTSGESPSVTITFSAPASAAAPNRSEEDWPQLPVDARHGLGALEVDAPSDLLGLRPEHHDDPLELRHRALGADRVLQERPAVELGQQLRLGAEPGARAGGEDQPGDHIASSSSASASKDIRLFPVRSSSVCGTAARIPRVSGS